MVGQRFNTGTREQMSPLILSIETATLAGSLAIMRGQHVINSKIGDPELSHSNTLLRDIDQILADAEVSLREVELFAASIGPGSFTGLRIGIATVKGLASTLNRPCAGVPTLHAIARAAGPSKATVALLPAGRSEVFVQLLSVTADGLVSELDNPAHISPQRMLEHYGHLSNVVWAGQGAQVYAEPIRKFAAERQGGLLTTAASGNGWKLADQQLNLAQHVGALAARRAESGDLDSADSLQALYVRPSDAELNPKFSVSVKK
jgi:tRNA threonylcarbamoyladenosine biosynthesis protein TsaB